MLKRILFLSICLLPLAILVGYFSLDSYIQSSPDRKPLVTPTIEPEPTRPPLSAEKLTALVNEWRVSQGFQPYVKNEDLCRIAVDRSDEGLDNHEGFMKKYSSYPSAIQENIAGGAIEELALDAWLHSEAHLATLKKPYRYACIACHKKQCNQIFSNLENGTSFNYPN